MIKWLKHCLVGKPPNDAETFYELAKKFGQPINDGYRFELETFVINAKNPKNVCILQKDNSNGKVPFTLDGSGKA